MKKDISKRLIIMSAVLLSFGSGHALAEGDGKGHHKGAKFEKHDLNGDGTISEDEFLQHAKDRFSNIDANGDGSVSEEEAKAHHKAKRAEMKARVKERRQERREKRNEAAE